MTRKRTAATLIFLLTVAASPSGASAATGPAPLSPTPPSWLTETSTTPPATAPAPSELPHTGDDLLLDGLVALGLLGGGVVLRLQRS